MYPVRSTHRKICYDTISIYEVREYVAAFFDAAKSCCLEFAVLLSSRYRALANFVHCACLFIIFSSRQCNNAADITTQ